MKKKKQRQMQRQSQVNQPKKETLTLGDQLNDSLMQQLKSKKKELQVREEEKRLNWKSAKNKKNVKRINHLKNC